jgi:hypothetical protein
MPALIFQERAALDRVPERLLDLNRSIGGPDKLNTVFGYRITKAYRGGLKTQIADHDLGNPVIRSEYDGRLEDLPGPDTPLRQRALVGIYADQTSAGPIKNS